jgi:putative FmdB family regulatory protein
MPTYEYRCKKCGKEFEYMQRISEDALNLCPESICENEQKGTGEVYRLLSKNIGLHFKGTGFYLTDYANKKTSTAPTDTPKTTDTPKPVESKPATSTDVKVAG